MGVRAFGVPDLLPTAFAGLRQNILVYNRLATNSSPKLTVPKIDGENNPC